MSIDDGFRTKIDALDLIISALKAHEKRLDEISFRLEDLSERGTRNQRNRRKTIESDEGFLDEDRKEEIEALNLRLSRVETLVGHKALETEAKAQDKATDLIDLKRVRGPLIHTRARESEKWSDFKSRSKGSNVISYKISNNSLNVYSIVNGTVQRYSGQIQVFLSLEQEFKYESSHSVSSEELKDFLAEQLGVSRDSVIEGEIKFSVLE